MRRISRIGLVLYLIAGVLVVGACAGSLFGPYTERFASMLASGSGRVTMAICLVIVALNLIAVLMYLLVDRPEPRACGWRATRISRFRLRLWLPLRDLLPRSAM